jgi:hypothetical protein
MILSTRAATNHSLVLQTPCRSHESLGAQVSRLLSKALRGSDAGFEATELSPEGFWVRRQCLGGDPTRK